MMNHTNQPDDFAEIHIIPYVHTDYAWTNSRDWHIWRYLYAFRRALELMREDDSFTFVIDNVHHAFLAFETHCPELMEEMRQRVREGRLVIAGGGYALARPNYSGEEAYVRNLIAGQRFFAERFDMPEAESRFFFNADTAIGHSQLPQLLQLSGYRYYRANRPMETMNRKGIPRQFVWQGLDGSEVIVARGEYGGFFLTDYFDQYPDMEADWEALREAFWAVEGPHASNSASDKLMMFFGCDDVIPGCNLIDQPVPINRFMETWNRRQRAQMVFSTPGRYFAALEAETERLPHVSGVLDNCELSYNVPHKGRQSFWYRRKILERLILRLEYTRALLPEKTDQADLNQLWQALFGISGHALEFVLRCDIEEMEQAADEAILRCRRLLRETERRLAEQVEGPGAADERITRHIVINPLPEAREALVPLHITSPHGLKGLTLTDAVGCELPFQLLETYLPDKAYDCECNSADVLALVSLPAAGWTTVTARPGSAPLTAPPPSRLSQVDEPLTIDTGVLRATFERGLLMSIERGGRAMAGPFGLLRHARFQPRGVCWAPVWGDTVDSDFRPEEWGLVECGPLRWIYRARGVLGGAHATVDITLTAASPRVDYAVTLDCVPGDGLFTAAFPCDADTRLYADIPYGVEERDLTSEPSCDRQGDIYNPEHWFCWESAWRGQFYAKSFALFSSGGAPAALIADTSSIYYSLRRDLGTVSLLLHAQHDFTGPDGQSPEGWVGQLSPHFAGTGENTFTFAYLPLPDGEPEACFHRTAREARLMHFPPTAAPQFGFAARGTLPQTHSTLSCEGTQVIITAHYFENGRHIIRGYESAGKGGEVRLQVDGCFSAACRIDLRGHPLQMLDPADLRLTLRPWEIFTIRLTQFSASGQ